MKFQISYLILISVLFTTLVFGQIDQSETEYLDSLCNEIFPSNEPGGSILIKKKNEIIYLNSFGLSDLETKQKITEHTIFNTGSISKTFVSNGILILQERGLLSLEDQLDDFFDDFESPIISKKVKVQHLLSHTSGLPDIRKVNQNFNHYLTAKDAENFEPIKKTKNLNFEPGDKFQYSNPAYNGLALIIEKASKQKWQSFIHKNIFEPSGMYNSKITDGPYPESGVAHGYIRKNNQFVEQDYGETPTFAAAGNGGVWCSVLDLAKYENALGQSIFLSKESVKKSRTPFVPLNWKSNNKPKIGYSWFIESAKESRYNLEMIYHTGSQGGFNAFYFYFPKVDLLYIGLFNRPIHSDEWNKLVYGTLDKILGQSE